MTFPQTKEEAESKFEFGQIYRQGTIYWNTPEWKRLCRECFKRDGFRCFRCRTSRTYTRLTAHHIIPRSEGGGDYLENLITLCPECHDEVEISGFRTLAEIGCAEFLPIQEKKLKQKRKFIEDFKRPLWHKWVYGGERKPVQEWEESIAAGFLERLRCMASK